MAGAFQTSAFANAAFQVESIAPPIVDDGGVFKAYQPFRPALPTMSGRVDVTEKPDTLEAYAGVVQFPVAQLPRKRGRPRVHKFAVQITEQRDGISADAQWNLDPVLIDNELMLLLAA